ncbi:MAG: hypothetical protein ABI832_05490 [bacterium]
MIRAAALLAFLAGPAMAQDTAMLNQFARGLNKPAKLNAFSAAAAACLLGNGKTDDTAARFTKAGWAREDDTEMGVTTLTPTDGGVYVSLYDAGKICDVASEVWGTEKAIGALQVVAGGSGLALQSVDNASTCDTYALSDQITVEITSSGNDPVCYSETTSTLRFTFADAS